MSGPKLRTFVCSRQVECLVEVRAANLAEALSQLPGTADDLVEQADACAFGSNWSIQVDGISGAPQEYDDKDVADAMAHGVEFMLDD